MAGSAALFWISLVFSVIGLNADGGELYILHCPESLGFSGTREVPESTLKEIFSAALGLSVEENSDWDGLRINDPFNTPECAVEVYIDGVSSLGNAAHLKSQKFPLKVDEYEPITYSEVEHRLLQRYTNGGNKLVNVDLSGDIEKKTIFGDINAKPKKQTLQHLKLNIEEDSQFLRELEALKTISEKVKSGAVVADNTVDFYHFRIRSLHALSDFHGASSLQTKEAKKLLGEALEDLTAAFVKAYDGSVLVTAVTTNIAHTRRMVRDTRQNEARQMEDEHLNDGYSADYAAIFNIILWFGVVFTFTLVAIVYALADMDPGRDSIIYRMTSTRMKKDN